MRTPHHALDVLADPPEAADVSGDEGEGDGVQAARRRLGGRHRRQVNLHPHLHAEG